MAESLRRVAQFYLRVELELQGWRNQGKLNGPAAKER
jgi:hypothetical protein